MEITTQLQVDQVQIEDALRTYAAKWPAYGVLKDAMSYSLLSGGKRIRPVLVLEICKLFGGTAEDALPFACGLEMVHTYSLIHDDLPCMDDDDFRRGKPTNHKVFGQANAVLAGDALLTTAFAVLAEASLPAERVQRGIAALANAAGPNGMVGGQVLDLLGEGNSLQEEEILAIESLKTGCMIEAAARLGAIAAGSTPEEEAAAAAYARENGMLPVSIIDKPLDHRMASTIRHNRARGTHNVDLMSNIIKELHELGRSDAWISKHLGMEKDEILRLKQITGLAALFQEIDFGAAWQPVEEEEEAPPV